MWVSRGGPRWSRLNVQQYPLFEFRVPPESYLASPSRPATARQLLPWTFAPYSTSGTEGPLHTGFTCPLRSALRVWLPSRRFPPFDPVPAFFHAGSAHGIHPSEHSPLERSPARFRTADTHLPFLLQLNHLPRQEAGPAGRGFWVYPSESSWRPDVGLAHRPLVAPLGFSLLGLSLDSLDRDFAQPPPTRFIGLWLPTYRPAPRSLDRPPPAPGLFPKCKHSRTIREALLGFLHRNTPEHSSPTRLWLSFSPLAAWSITAHRPAIFETGSGLYRSCRDCLRCLAIATSASQHSM